MKRFIFVKGSSCPPCKVFQKTWESFIEHLDMFQHEIIVDPDSDFCSQYGIKSVPCVICLEDTSFKVLVGSNLKLTSLIAQL